MIYKSAETCEGPHLALPGKQDTGTRSVSTGRSQSHDGVKLPLAPICLVCVHTAPGKRTKQEEIKKDAYSKKAFFTIKWKRKKPLLKMFWITVFDSLKNVQVRMKNDKE